MSQVSCIWMTEIQLVTEHVVYHLETSFMYVRFPNQGRDISLGEEHVVTRAGDMSLSRRVNSKGSMSCQKSDDPAF